MSTTEKVKGMTKSLRVCSAETWLKGWKEGGKAAPHICCTICAQWVQRRGGEEAAPGWAPAWSYRQHGGRAETLGFKAPLAYMELLMDWFLCLVFLKKKSYSKKTVWLPAWPYCLETELRQDLLWQMQLPGWDRACRKGRSWLKLLHLQRLCFCQTPWVPSILKLAALLTMAECKRRWESLHPGMHGYMYSEMAFGTQSPPVLKALADFHAQGRVLD